MCLVGTHVISRVWPCVSVSGRSRVRACVLSPPVSCLPWASTVEPHFVVPARLKSGICRMKRMQPFESPSLPCTSLIPFVQIPAAKPCLAAGWSSSDTQAELQRRRSGVSLRHNPGLSAILTKRLHSCAMVSLRECIYRSVFLRRHWSGNTYIYI